MKVMLVLAAVLASCLAIPLEDPVAGLSEGANCVPGSRWKNDCNWCSCTETGIGMCTLMACVPEFNVEPEELVCEGDARWKFDHCNWCSCVNGTGVCSKKICEQECKGDPNTSRWRVECNWCRCISGYGVCTRKGCPKVIMDRLDNTNECEGTPEWKKDCNTCNCVSGRAVCTTKYCGASPDTPNTTGIEVNQEERTCTEGSRWRVSCNWCFCANGVSSCTKLGCRPDHDLLALESGEANCVGDSKWKVGCNWCSCHNGRGMCTKDGCFEESKMGLGVVVNQMEEAVCTEGSSWRESCNWCICQNGTTACTQIACPPDYVSDEPECENGSHWKMDCNWCDCYNGVAYCQRKACFSANQAGSTVEVEGDATCLEGSRWRQSCNWCQCLGGRGSCTEIGCQADYQTEEAECDVGAQWKKDCNWCTCYEGRAICSKLSCDGFEVPVQQREANCTEGSRWRQSCNWCECLGGRGECTANICLVDFQTEAAECEAGARWKKDCNWCNCRNGRASCSKLGCVVPQNGDLVCTEGKSWRENCNICRCSYGRTICTTELCAEPDAANLKCRGETKDGCSVPELPPHCKLPPVSTDGPACEDLLNMRMWTYDFISEKCKETVYGGCGRTKNLYETEAECRASCKLVSSLRTYAVDTKPEKCFKKHDIGPCFASYVRFAYNAESGQCEEFLYGGCQGNANRFLSLEECQQECGGVTTAAESSCDRSECPWKRWGHYFTKNCLPQYERGSCCPTSFSCPNETSSDPMNCYFKGKAYAVGSSVPVDNSCSVGCFCAESRNPGNLATIVCADIDCPGHLQAGCRPLYRPGDCCPYDYECVDPDTPPQLDSRSLTCIWNNKTYLEGDQMFFDDLPCQECVCSPDFTDPHGLGCSRITCGLEFGNAYEYSQGCVPIYFEERCCSIDWLCPDDNRILPPQPKEQDPGSEHDQEAGIVNVCTLPKDSGPCAEDTTRIYYDAEASQCRQFSYGGCDGNNNNFLDFEECHQLCSKTPKPSESAYWVLYHVNLHHDANGHTEWTRLRIHGDLRTQAILDGLDPMQTYVVGVAAQNAHGHSDVSHQVVFSLIPSAEPLECYLGVLNIALGSTLNTSECTLDCKCITPPEVTCVQYRSCTLAQETQDAQACAKPSCASGCNTVMEAASGCFTCLCSDESFSCPPQTCPDNCKTVLDLQTGCPSCECYCKYDTEGEPLCPMNCSVYVFVDQVTGCKTCECNPDSPGSPFFHTTAGEHHPCPKDHIDHASCPLNCTVHWVMDENLGCDKCECVSDDSHKVSPHLGEICPVDHTGQAPCPMDCAIRRVVDKETGCEMCECDPNNPGHPFGPLIIPPPSLVDNCPTDYTGHAPCPMDCAIRRVVDKETGCEMCECDPNNPGHPFGPLIIPPPSLVDNCPTDYTGHAPCPMDCAIRRVVDKETGCEMCECDPNNPGHPFGPLIIPPPPGNK
ncbi:kielin/chordin-like protein isoform X4 [Homarus americanus]|uniref:kielin/chordin-like protein isoform X4 n=1 Tax=Homarus americanus TaxID=6706 RepID=UPI001C446456|nr:kielin/chordin-like protein isoform X4 [Homarus americanus]